MILVINCGSNKTGFITKIVDDEVGIMTSTAVAHRGRRLNPAVDPNRECCQQRQEDDRIPADQAAVHVGAAGPDQGADAPRRG